MFSIFKSKKFEPDFPIIELDASVEEVFDTLSNLSLVEKDEETEDDVDFSYIAYDGVTRIHVGFVGDEISYINYLTERFNKDDKQRALKLNWFLNHYGHAGGYKEPIDTGYMLIFENDEKNLSIVFGLHKGPIRVNNNANKRSQA